MHQSQSIPQPDSQHSDIFHTFSIQPLYRTYSIYNLTSLTKPLLYDAIEISFRILTARSTFVHRAAHIFSAFSLLIDEIDVHLYLSLMTYLKMTYSKNNFHPFSF